MKVVKFEPKKDQVSIQVSLEYQQAFLEKLKLDYPAVIVRFTWEELRKVDTALLNTLIRTNNRENFFNYASLFLSDAVFYSVMDEKPLTIDYLEKALLLFCNEFLPLDEIEQTKIALQNIEKEPCKILQFKKR